MGGSHLGLGLDPRPPNWPLTTAATASTWSPPPPSSGTLLAALPNEGPWRGIGVQNGDGLRPVLLKLAELCAADGVGARDLDDFL